MTRKDKGKEVREGTPGPTKGGPRAVTIPPPNMEVAIFMIEGTEPYVQNAFTKKARDQMEKSHREGQPDKKRKKKPPRNFEAEFPESIHTAIEGWDGFPASAIRNGMISACSLVDFRMTLAKKCLFVLADGYDLVSGQPLVRMLEGKPEMKGPEPLPNADGTMHMRIRAIWAPGWRARVRIRFDADKFMLADVANLLNRVGVQIGIGAGRPDSKNSPGCGWGLFTLVEEKRR